MVATLGREGGGEVGKRRARVSPTSTMNTVEESKPRKMPRGNALATRVLAGRRCITSVERGRTCGCGSPRAPNEVRIGPSHWRKMKRLNTRSPSVISGICDADPGCWCSTHPKKFPPPPSPRPLPPPSSGPSGSGGNRRGYSPSWEHAMPPFPLPDRGTWTRALLVVHARGPPPCGK
jgi:hypothetical protein